MNSSHFSILIAALAVVAMEDGLCADQQPAPQKPETTVVAEGISSKPGAVDVRTGTGELQETIERFLGLPRDTGFFLGGLWAADAITWLPVAPIRASGALIDC
jgi:hypothetical protein